ncbi:hypothetical protein HHI36_003871 [Cryptolaemus montrouzieri]|uniref:C-type lectin domain-containing protein n=1 Tax=Cryptolaemus montrouzieri TaxID=559131 RepID=A0ABD2NPQ5_9CUCU
MSMYVFKYADTSSQYDAIRAYLKELDITDNVWIGLSKKSEKDEFAWSDSRLMSGEGHWRESIPVGGEPLCVTMDPTADFLWKPYPCGGPEAASFICELPVPSWALGQKGCLLTELPSLTVLYIPEQMALELTSDCGLDGTKRITCKGNADREEILKQLTCAISNDDDFEDKISSRPVPSSTNSDVTDASLDLSSTERSGIWTSNTIDTYELSTRHRRETEQPLIPSEATISYRKSDLIVSIPAFHVTGSNDDMETTSMNSKEDSSFVVLSHSSEPTINLQADKPSYATPAAIKAEQDINTRQEDLNSTITPDIITTGDVKPSDTLGEDIAEYPSAINQGQLFSIIENGTMFDIIELNDTGIDDSKTTKTVLTSTKTPDRIEKLEKTSTPSMSTTTLHENTNSYTTVVYYKEPPPESTLVTNKSPKKMNIQSKIKYYKKSDPKNINFQSEKEQRRIKEEKFNLENGNKTEMEKDLNKEVEMFPLIGSGGPLVKLNRTHRKELPIIDENEKNIFEMNNENLKIINSKDVEANRLEIIEDQEHEKSGQAKNDDVFIVTTKFHDGVLGKNYSNRNESTTTFSENDNDTNKAKIVHDSIRKEDGMKPTNKLFVEINKKPLTLTSTTTNILIDPKLDELNKNISQNNDSEVLPELAEVEKIESESAPWEKDEMMSKSLLGEIETITDDVIENNTSNLENPTSEPLNSEPITPYHPNRRRRLTNTQRRSYYPYFFSRVLG